MVKISIFVDDGVRMWYYKSELNKFTQCVLYAAWVYEVKRETGENPERNCRCKHPSLYFVGESQSLRNWEGRSASVCKFVGCKSEDLHWRCRFLSQFLTIESGLCLPCDKHKD